jgi:DNA-binding SARP family transcriptional activator
VHVEIALLGQFDCRADGRSLLLAPRGERLLAFLALHRRPVRRDRVFGALWADITEERASGNLRSTLWRLPRPEGSALVDTADGHIRLSDAVRVDLWGVEARDPESLEERLMAGDLLPGWDDEWVLAERERYRQLRLHLLEELCDQHRVRARYIDALRLGLAAVEVEPLRETAHRHVMQVHLSEGNTSEALRQYDSYRRILHAELGLPPSPAMRALVDDVLDQPADRHAARWVPRPTDGAERRRPAARVARSA